MFTGLIEEVGRLQAITKGAKETVFTIAAKTVLDETTKVGFSKHFYIFRQLILHWFSINSEKRFTPPHGGNKKEIS